MLINHIKRKREKINKNRRSKEVNTKMSNQK